MSKEVLYHSGEATSLDLVQVYSCSTACKVYSHCCDWIELN